MTNSSTKPGIENQPKYAALQVGIDIGGTFTDFVVYSPNKAELQTFKILSTPDDPAQAILDGLSRLEQPIEVLVHGSTVATNALIERKGARTALITTRGFRDVLEIGRQNRPDLYSLNVQTFDPLIPRKDRFEMDERIDCQGHILKAFELRELEGLAGRLQAGGYELIAICFLFSFLQPEHELRVAARLRKDGFFVSASAEIIPEYREYERTSTTAINAYVTPILDGYLKRLETALQADQQPVLSVMQSNGGHISFSEARQAGVRCILSGPAGGIVGARLVGELARHMTQSENALEHQTLRLLTFDMGGTSTDVSLILDTPQVTSEAVIGGLPIKIPVLDIHTIGAGGGSIASIDAGGALRVGPQSAGADPGPACYGHLDHQTILPTVTDANLLLGRLPADYFLGGEMPLDESRSRLAYQPLAVKLGMSVQEVALGVIEVANAHMERALRVISVERGHDPRHFSLVSFGGAGGLHAADLARRLGIPRVIVPRLASTLSAFGMLASDVIKDYSQTVMLPADSEIDTLLALFTPMVGRALTDLAAENIARDTIRIERMLDVRYIGQSYELSLRLPGSGPNIPDQFHELHKATYGYDRLQTAVEIVNLRVRATGPGSAPQLLPTPSENPEPSRAFLRTQTIVFPSGAQVLPVYLGDQLSSGSRLNGAALVLYPDTTVLIGAQDSAWLDPYGSLQITVGELDYAS